MKLKTKAEYRKYALLKRKSGNIEEQSNAIISSILNMPAYKKANNILAYYPFREEIDIQKLFSDFSKNWLLPRCDIEKRELIIHQYEQSDILNINKWGVSEPSEKNEKIEPRKIDLAIIPALMTDETGIRLGYGAGFYDRFLPFLSENCLKITVVQDELLVGELPFDKNDVRVDVVLTEKRIHYCK